MPKLLADLKLKKVGCVLLQAIYGGDRGLATRIGNEHWFLSPTEDMKLYEIPEEQCKEIIEGFQKMSNKV